MRLIDADALIEFCAERWIPLNIDAVNMQPTIQPVATDTNVGDTISRQQAIDALDCISGVEEVLKSLPSVQPEPKEGHWIEGGIYREVIECNCSECGQIMTTVATVRMNYCPRCGAKMKGATP